MPDPLFIYFTSDEGPFLLNLYQIVRVDDITDDQITLHTSDGVSNTLHGKQAVESIVQLLTQYTMAMDGRPLQDVSAESPSDGLKLGPRLVKPIDTES
jgi:hypothetical protein